MSFATSCEEWLASLDLEKTRVQRSPSFIFLCGGSADTSCRNVFLEHIKEVRYSFLRDVLLAEEVFDLVDPSIYTDLIQFEGDLATLSALTIIFSESAGSIAELGAFTVLQNIQDKLLVVLHTEDAWKKSFIWRGPALYLRSRAETNGNASPVYVYNWVKLPNSASLTRSEIFSDAEDLAQTVEKMVLSSPKTKAWDAGNRAHRLLFILDCLTVMRLATRSEILEILEWVGAADATEKRVEQLLSLLCILKLAVRWQYRNTVFYLSSSSRTWLSFAFASAAKIRDVDRWIAYFSENYREADDEKSRALRSYVKSLPVSQV